ncbi:MAG TPA: hypothetical protein VGM29_06830 [Polyangiaceae bacterium]|jgi:hypothetical protein
MRSRVCSLATAGLLSAACGGTVSSNPQPVLSAGNAGGAGASAGGATSGGSATGGASGGVATGGAGAAGSGGTGGIVIVEDAGPACSLDCGNNDSCLPCTVYTQPADGCTLTVPGSGAPVQGVSFDCSPLSNDESGYTVDAQGQVVLMGEACDALKTSAPHRIDFVLGCSLDK